MLKVDNKSVSMAVILWASLFFPTLPLGLETQSVRARRKIKEGTNGTWGDGQKMLPMPIYHQKKPGSLCLMFGPTMPKWSRPVLSWACLEYIVALTPSPLHVDQMKTRKDVEK